MNASKHKTLPISYAITGETRNADTRFLNITIDVLHTGMNFNGSIFKEEIVNANIDSIKNTPILGFIQADEGAADFTEHEYRFLMDDDGIRFVYAGHAYGVIPESCNPRWIEKVSSDGVLRKYLQVDALLWTKFGDAVSIFQRDRVKGQSMELEECSMQGIEHEDHSFEFTSFKFDGCCILSTNNPQIQPAMIDSIAAAHFSASSIATEIKQKLMEYADLTSHSPSDEGVFDPHPTQEGADDPLKEKLALLEQYGVTKDEIAALEIDLEAISLDELENKLKEIAEAKNDASEEAPANNAKTDPKEGEGDTGDGESTGDKPDLDEQVAALNDALTKAQEALTTALTQIDDLTEFKKSTLAAQRAAQEEALFSTFKADLTNSPEFAELKKNAAKFSIAELEEKCFAILGKAKANFSKKDPVVRLPIDTGSNQEEEPYGGLFSKYSLKD